MRYAKVWAAILAILGAIGAFILGKRSGVRDNGSGADGIGDGLDDSADRASTIADGIGNAQKSVDNITVRIDNASKGISNAIGIVQNIRNRGAKKTDDASD